MIRSPGGTAFQLHSPGDAPLVVLIHGLGLTHAVWDDVGPDLARRYRVLSYDMSGHGETPAATNRPSLALLARQLADLPDHCAARTAVVAGFSLGGMIARRFAQDFPDRTTALAVLHSAHRRTPATQAAIVAGIDGAQTVILPGLRHMAMMEDPASTSAALLAFLDRAVAHG